MKLTFKQIKLNNILLYLIVIISFLSYERTLYRAYYKPLISSVLVLGMLLFLLNINKKDRYKRYYNNLIKNNAIHIFTMLVLMSTLVASIKYGLISFGGLFNVVATIISLYIFYLFIPVLIYEDLDKWIIKLIKLITLFSLISILIKINGNFIGYTETHYKRISSIFFDPNYFGTMASIGFMLSINRSKKFKVMGIINLIALYLSGSRAAMLSLIFVIVVFFFYNKKIKYKDIFKLLLLAIILYFSINILVDVNFFRIYQGLSSRDFLWKLSFKLIYKEPIWGYGYGAVGDLLKDMGATNASSHNSYLDYIMMYGTPVFIINIFIILKGLLKGIKNKLPQEITKSIIFLLITANSISINLGGLGALSLLLTIFLGLSNISESKVS